MSKVWSYSRLSSYHQCPYSFYLSYIKEREGVDNAWSDTGTHCHWILEEVGNGNMPVEAVLDAYTELFPELSYPFPDLSKKYDYGQKVYDDLKAFFANFNGLEGETLGIEKYFKIKLPNGDYLQGYIDRVFELDGACIEDYKISNPFKKKEIIEKERQLYVYAIAHHAETGEYPRMMRWHHLKDDKKVEIEFEESKVQSTMDWIMSTIETISKDEGFEAKAGRFNFFCQNLCSHRMTCEFKGMD